MPASLRIIASLLFTLLLILSRQANAQPAYTPPASPRVSFDFNADWKFMRQDVSGAEAPGFDDSKWDNISTPHSFNDVDSFRVIISHGGGDRGTYKGIAWYRKHFKIPASFAGRKIFLEFQGMRQAGDIYLNGKDIGLYENGVTAYGLDITPTVKIGADENVLAVKVDNRTTYKERSTGVGFQWNANDFNPDHGGINRPVWLHITGPIHQTFPLYYGLQTTGTCIYGDNYNIPAKTCDVTVESQTQNDTDDRATVGLSVAIVDHDGILRAQFDGDPVDMVAGEKTDLTATGPLAAARFWSTDDPYLYNVYTLLTVNGKIVDAVKNTTGFRKTEFKGGAGTGGVFVNDKFTWLKGFAQRSSDEWAGVGGGYPDWMHDFTANLIRACHGNYVRWMHISPQRADVDACDRAGIIEVCPAGDKEVALPHGRPWEQRVEVMRDSMIYFRNNPSILFWEVGNSICTPDQMQEMVNLRKQWDPHGGRLIGTRDNDNSQANNALTPIAEYYGVMIGQDPKTDAIKAPGQIFRGYSVERRDRGPLIEAEDFRDEAARRYWDNYSPPYFGFKIGPADNYDWNSETFCIAGAARYWAYYSNMISNPDPNHSKWSGYASIYFSDSDADGRQDSSEVCRVSGKVDAVRLPKELYYVTRVMQSDTPDLHIIGHWTYPAGTQKTVYVACNCKSVELFLNGKSLGTCKSPPPAIVLEVTSARNHAIKNKQTFNTGYIFSFPNVQWQPGILKAVGYDDGKEVCSQELTTAGPATAIKLTPIVAPDGFKANGGDVALFDVEAVDAKGERCPTDDARVDFNLTGPALWRGGYNSGKINSTNNLYLNTECGINRVAIRSTRIAGKIVLTASRPGLASATAEVETKPVKVTDGIAGL